MSDSDDDYMSDKILVECTQKDVRPGLLFRSSQKRSLEIYKNQQETLKKPKPKEQEQQRREEGLSTALSSDNKGYKMLEKMGYTPGTGLGKSSIGIKEPVAITIKTNAAGVGREQHILNVKKNRINLKEKHLQACENEFLAAKTEKLLASSIKSDLYKAQRLCEDLDMKNGIEYPEFPYFWQKSTIEALNKKKGADDEEEEEEEDEEEKSDDDSSISVNDFPMVLQEIITYLRTTYNYCMYCGDFIEDESECPGYSRADHD